ncbi:hypothetical protein ACFVYG_36760 [Streptomyces sp. NPDC058256]|uniref:hypothetical protein n=1 Tax=Streptomyces sp. NPDC058256 TaxID=3346408 RepID=UPI0036E99398
MSSDLISWLPVVAAFLLGFIALPLKNAVWSILRSIFRSPRGTSVIVTVDGKRVELEGPLTNSEIQTAIRKLRMESDLP